MDQIRTALISRLLAASPNKQKDIIDRIVNKSSKRKLGVKRLDYDKNGKWSKELIVDTLRRVLLEHEKLSIPLLRKLRREDPKNYPAPTTIVNRFGSWEEAKKEVSGRARPLYLNILGKIQGVEYFLRLYHQGKVSTRALYFEARRKYPEAVPPYQKLLDVFGTFTNFKRIAKVDSSVEQINSLIRLVDDLGGLWPKRSQCKSRGIDIVFLDKKMGSRKELRDTVYELRSVFKNT